MSLPLTRRIARAALLVAAGAAAGVGAAGSASAAPELSTAPNLGGLTALDGATGNTVSSVTQSVTETAEDADKVVPAVDTTVEKTAPVVKKLPTESLTRGGVPSARTLPVQDLPLG
ncbi:ATP-binding protein [Streptomyces sp.]|uniref:ATP-binding protein n=1 Tax=Streptomyces sp. TaxID=1931 RepID=UPI0028121E3F|nr:ATP-binding protein [Streptomyces sp.]